MNYELEFKESTLKSWITVSECSKQPKQMLFNRDKGDKGDKTENHKGIFGSKPRNSSFDFYRYPFHPVHPC